MLAIVFDGKPILRKDYPEPVPARDEALVAVRLAGVCKTDLEILKGYMNFRGVMGHEFVGQVVAGPRQWKGKRVVGEINCVCGRCDMCKSGLSNHCRDRTVIGIDGRDGVFAELVALPLRNLHHVADGISDEQAVWVEPLAAAFQIVRQVKLDASTKVVVLGDGRLGQMVVRVLKPLVGRVLMVGRHAEKLEAAEKVAIETKLEKDFVPAATADVVVDATGSVEGFNLATKAVRPRGTIVLKSTIAAKEGMNLSPLVINEVSLIGSRCGPFPEALLALADGRIDVSALAGRTYPLSQGLEALAAAASGQYMKVLIDARG